MDEKKRSLGDICEELCPGVKARNANAFKHDPDYCAHGLKKGTCGSPMCETEEASREKQPTCQDCATAAEMLRRYACGRGVCDIHAPDPSLPEEAKPEPGTRDLAITIVDGLLGYSMEHSSSPAHHRSGYDWVEEKLTEFAKAARESAQGAR